MLIISEYNSGSAHAQSVMDVRAQVKLRFQSDEWIGGVVSVSIQIAAIHFTRGNPAVLILLLSTNWLQT